MSQKKELEDLAKKRGVVLAGSTPEPASAAAPVVSDGWLAKVMPNAAPMMADLKEKCGPEIWAGAMKLMKRDVGYVVDLGTNIAVGNPPLERFTRGKTEKRDGLTVMRVRPKERGK